MLLHNMIPYLLLLFSIPSIKQYNAICSTNKAAIISLIISSFAWANPDGALPSACLDMIPKHGKAKEQDLEKCPFKLIVTLIEGLDHNVRLESKNKDKNGSIDFFKGFLITSLNKDNNGVGKFTPSDVSKHVQCKIPQATLTHVNSERKTEFEAKWTGTKNLKFMKETVFFYATIVQDKDTFWVKLTTKFDVGTKVVSANSRALRIMINARSLYASTVVALLVVKVGFRTRIMVII